MLVCTPSLTSALLTAGVVASPAALLALLGFTTGGVLKGTYVRALLHLAAGSAAALIQSYFYGGATGGAFSAFQSAGVLGVSGWVMSVLGSAVSLVTVCHCSDDG